MPEIAMSQAGAAARVLDCHSQDAAVHAGQLPGWTMRMEQFSAGCFSGHTTVLLLDHVHVIRERTSQALMKQGMARPGALIFSLPMAASGDGYVNGHVLAFPCPLFSDGADLPSLLTPQYLDVAHLVVDRQWLAGYFRDLGECRLADDVVEARYLRISVSSGGIAAMQRVITDVFEICARTRVFDFEESRNDLENVLLRFVADALMSERKISMSYVTSQKKIADRAFRYALSHRETPPSIAELCRHVGVSRRTLQDCFQDVFGISPSQYLRFARLNAVRRDLMVFAATGRHVSIGEVAASWGFWHWSHFAERYRELFGELPSQTLQRNSFRLP
ncbi:AraC family transcriptional regulator [Bradyrhizobium sp. SSBR45G]|uniref:helix-turn-helix domain-containing protein n=1 Tax=unclassified Bradyrhizobium TaxID=2631580 RepID=UPI002342A6B2|nr:MULTISPECIES: helix-turn-helix domain-containing protein [unclassified Bradyrhizobium]GLH80180.1 AraC family transcriptional regulator [Bradyrhizobium sp. SSBR45G]GLH87673.1 AraC family transcriptional regulator [Bradyrhizobium sp. SSBR45R]